MAQSSRCSLIIIFNSFSIRSGFVHVTFLADEDHRGITMEYLFSFFSWLRMLGRHAAAAAAAAETAAAAATEKGLPRAFFKVPFLRSLFLSLSYSRIAWHAWNRKNNFFEATASDDDALIFC